MRHLILFTILTVTVIIGLVMAVSAHNGSVHTLSLKNAQAAALRVRQAAKVQAQAQSTIRKLQVANTDIVLLVAQCKNGQAAYNLLTPSQKLHDKEPYCSYSQVQ